VQAAVNAPVNHFWDPQAALSELQLVNQSANIHNESTTQNAWATVLAEVFPVRETVHDHTFRWRIPPGKYRGFLGAEGMIQPDILTLKVTDTQAVPGANQRPAFSRHDYPTIEKRAASHNTPAGLRNLLNETTTRLSQFCANHEI
jgi:hypothetical protein